MICAGFITVSVKKLLGPTLSGRRFITVSGVFITLSGVFITLPGVLYYIIEHVLQYRAFITLSVGTASHPGSRNRLDDDHMTAVVRRRLGGGGLVHLVAVHGRLSYFNFTKRNIQILKRKNQILYST